MNDFLKKEDESIETVGIGEKKIEFKLIKDKRALRTFVLNLEHYITDATKLETTLKNLKKAMGTSCVKEETKDSGTWYGFNGDLKVRISQYLIDNQIVPKTAFK